MKPDDVLNILKEKAKDFGGQQAKYHYGVLTKTTEETGNVVKGNGEPFNMDMFFEVMDKIQIDFDEYGNPNMPTMVVAPDGYERARAVMQEAEQNPDVKKRMDELIAKKKKEYDAEQAGRKLVD